MSFNFTKTLQDVYNTGYAIIKQPENSTSYDTTTFFLPKINEAQQDINNWWLINLSTWQTLDKISLPFNQSTQFYSSVINTSLTAVAVVWWTTLDATTTDYPTSWTLYIAWDIITYTWTSSTQFTWVTWINFAHESWKQIRLLFTLPTNFWQLNRIFYKNRFTLVSVDQRDLLSQDSFNRFNFFNDEYWDNLRNEFYYSLIDWQYLLPLIPSETWKQIRFEFEKKPTQLVAGNASSQTLGIPDEYSLSTITYLSVSKMLIERWEADEWIKLNNIWFQNVKKMYDYYNTIKSELIYNQRVRTQKDWWLNI